MEAKSTNIYKKELQTMTKSNLSQECSFSSNRQKSINLKHYIYIIKDKKLQQHLNRCRGKILGKMQNSTVFHDENTGKILIMLIKSSIEETIMR